MFMVEVGPEVVAFFFCVCIPCRQSRHTQNSLAGRIPLNKVLSLVWQEFDIY